MASIIGIQLLQKKFTRFIFAIPFYVKKFAEFNFAILGQNCRKISSLKVSNPFTKYIEQIINSKNVQINITLCSTIKMFHHKLAS